MGPGSPPGPGSGSIGQRGWWDRAQEGGWPPPSPFPPSLPCPLSPLPLSSHRLPCLSPLSCFLSGPQPPSQRFCRRRKEKGRHKAGGWRGDQWPAVPFAQGLQIAGAWHFLPASFALDSLGLYVKVLEKFLPSCQRRCCALTRCVKQQCQQHSLLRASWCKGPLRDAPRSPQFHYGRRKREPAPGHRLRATEIR